MTTKQYLQSYQNLERRYNVLIEQLRNIDNEVISLKSPGFDERVQTSAKNDPIGDIVINLVKEKGYLSMKLTECRSRMFLIRKQISEIDSTDNDYYVILLMRYILYKDWKFICASLKMSRAQANIIHGRALQEFDSKFNKYYAEK